MARAAPAPRRPSSPSSDRYREIQQALAERGFYSGPVTGDWDATSVAAVRSFQESQQLKVDGKLGARTLIALGFGPKRDNTWQEGEPLPEAALPQSQWR